MFLGFAELGLMRKGYLTIIRKVNTGVELLQKRSGKLAFNVEPDLTWLQSMKVDMNTHDCIIGHNFTWTI